MKFEIPAAFKIICVSIVCVQVMYLYYILFNNYFPAIEIQNTKPFVIGPYLFVAIIFFFGQYYLKQKRYLKFIVWIILTASLSLNAYMRYYGIEPSIIMQYSQSTSLLIYAFVLIFSRGNKPNWERIFAIVCFIILIPCLIFFFTEQWFIYESLVYVLSFTPIINSLVFLQKPDSHSDEILDVD